MHDPFQSAYMAHHGIETALLPFNNDILCALYKGQVTAVLLIWVWHLTQWIIIFSFFSLNSHVGIEAMLWNGVSCILSNRPQHVLYCRCYFWSSHSELFCTTTALLCPRPSVVYYIYTYPICEISLRYKIHYPVYADDTQIFLPFNSGHQECVSAIDCHESCNGHVLIWTRENCLKLKDLIISHHSSVHHFWYLSSCIRLPFHILLLVIRVWNFHLMFGILVLFFMQIWLTNITFHAPHALPHFVFGTLQSCVRYLTFKC